MILAQVLVRRLKENEKSNDVSRVVIEMVVVWKVLASGIRKATLGGKLNDSAQLLRISRMTQAS